jgi:hypothetical protein
MTTVKMTTYGFIATRRRQTKFTDWRSNCTAGNFAFHRPSNSRAPEAGLRADNLQFPLANVLLLPGEN